MIVGSGGLHKSVNARIRPAEAMGSNAEGLGDGGLAGRVDVSRNPRALQALGLGLLSQAGRVHR